MENYIKISIIVLILLLLYMNNNINTNSKTIDVTYLDNSHETIHHVISYTLVEKDLICYTVDVKTISETRRLDYVINMREI